MRIFDAKDLGNHSSDIVLRFYFKMIVVDRIYREEGFKPISTHSQVV